MTEPAHAPLLPRPLRELTLASSPLAAASGLVRISERLYVIADDAHHLGVFPLAGDAPGIAVRLLDGALPDEPRARKRVKPDFEALVRLPPYAGHPHGALLALGSGSTPARCRGAAIALGEDGLPAAVQIVDLQPLYAALRAQLQVLNIEGALIVGGRMLLLQRGNDVPSRNAAVALRLDAVLEALACARPLDAGSLAAVVDYELGGVGRVRYGFSDGAALPDGRWVFAAIAEDTTDSYADGACSGSAVGIVAADGVLAALHPLHGGAKIEGIDAQLDGGAIDLLLVTDADDPRIPAQLLQARMPL